MLRARRHLCHTAEVYIPALQMLYSCSTPAAQMLYNCSDGLMRILMMLSRSAVYVLTTSQGK